MGLRLAGLCQRGMEELGRRFDGGNRLPQRDAEPRRADHKNSSENGKSWPSHPFQACLFESSYHNPTSVPSRPIPLAGSWLDLLRAARPRLRGSCRTSGVPWL